MAVGEDRFEGDAEGSHVTSKPCPESGGQRPLIVQRDRSVLLDLHVDGAEEVRVGLSRFAELVKSPEHLHTYRMTSLSLWHAAFSGMTRDDICGFLAGHSLTGVPKDVAAYIKEMLDRTGRIGLVRNDGRLVLHVDEEIREQILDVQAVFSLVEVDDAGTIFLAEGNRGLIKKALVKVGYPVDDVAGYEAGDSLSFEILGRNKQGEDFHLRHYQESAAQAFYCGGSERGGAGLVVLPCGAGKTIVALRIMELYQTQILILTTNRTAVAQFKRELLNRTSLRPDQVGEYTGSLKEIRPVTVSTYQILTHRRSKSEALTHFDLFSRANWGLVVYDEVHLLPAPVFRVTAELQARRRLGLTATLVREDGKEDEVFSLIGPCRYELPWRDLEKEGWIAEARCVEVRVPLDPDLMSRYELADNRGRIRIAAENPAKMGAMELLLEKHYHDRVLIIGQYLRQLYRVAALIGAPIITSKTPNDEREELYEAFRSGDLPVLIASKVANFAIDLPDANVAIQISGTFGSRQEEAQRLGRILRPKKGGGAAMFYTLVTAGTRDEEFSNHRQLFLAEQGYQYAIIEASSLEPKDGRDRDGLISDGEIFAEPSSMT